MGGLGLSALAALLLSAAPLGLSAETMTPTGKGVAAPAPEALSNGPASPNDTVAPRAGRDPAASHERNRRWRGPGLQGGKGQAAPADFDWTIRPLEGKPTTLEAFRGRVLFLHMWATWCRPCVAEMAEIQALMNSLAPADRERVAFLLVSPERLRDVRSFLRRYDYDLPVFLEVQEMPGAFGLEALPTTFIVDRKGRIVFRHRGALRWNQEPVRRFLRRLVSEGG